MGAFGIARLVEADTTLEEGYVVDNHRFDIEVKHTFKRSSLWYILDVYILKPKVKTKIIRRTDYMERIDCMLRSSLKL